MRVDTMVSEPCLGELVFIDFSEFPGEFSSSPIQVGIVMGISSRLIPGMPERQKVPVVEVFWAGTMIMVDLWRVRKAED